MPGNKKAGPTQPDRLSLERNPSLESQTPLSPP